MYTYMYYTHIYTGIYIERERDVYIDIENMGMGHTPTAEERDRANPVVLPIGKNNCKGSSNGYPIENLCFYSAKPPTCLKLER